MWIQLGTKQFEATPENASFLLYDNDMLNGLYVDLGREYCFISAHVDIYKQLADVAMAYGITGAQYDAGEYDFDQEPHRYVLSTLSNIVVANAISVTQECE